MILPAFFMLAISFMTPYEFDFVQLPFTLNNYYKVFSPLYLKMFISSIITAFCATLICLLIGYPVAYIISHSPIYARNFLIMLLIIPFWTSSLVRTYALITLIKANGVINNILLWLNLIKEPIEVLYTPTAVMLGLIYTLLPFMVLPLYSVLEKLDKRYIEAAQDLGAGKISLFFKVIIPLTMPGIFAGCILVFLPALSLFYIVDLLGGARNLLLGNVIKNQFLIARDWPFGSALCIVFTLLIISIIFVYFKRNKELSL
jgi:spermidine/putrescine transport system permease protein